MTILFPDSGTFPNILGMHHLRLKRQVTFQSIRFIMYPRCTQRMQYSQNLKGSSTYPYGEISL